jgi:hypothetical protein
MPRTILQIFLPLISFILLAQMPDWKYFKDREGNTYFIDRAGKIRITDVVEYRYKPVSAAGIDYYLNYGTNLIDEHHMVEGLSVLKSIRALPAGNNRIYQAQVKATELMRSLEKKNGPRFTAMNKAASLVIYRENGVTRIINDQMFYSLSIPAVVEVIRKRERSAPEYRYSGLLLGIRLEGKNTSRPGTYDMLLALDSEKFIVSFKDIAEAVEQWKGNTGFNVLAREVLEKNDDRVLCRIRYSGPQSYAGLEGTYVNGVFSHYARLVTPESAFAANSEVMRTIVDSFRMVVKVK